MENRITDLLKVLKKKNEISRETSNTLYSVGSKPGNLYGIHTPVTNNIPSFHPIVSATATPTC